MRLVERSAEPFTDAASAYAGAMLGPFCETEVYAPVVRDLGLKSIELWRETYPGTVVEGTLVVASARDKSEMDHFARLTEGHERIGGDAIARLEPDLAGSIRRRPVLCAGSACGAARGDGSSCWRRARRAGVECRLRHGLAAMQTRTMKRSSTAAASAPRTTLPDLRGVRGERLIVRTREIGFRRPVRFLHPRHPIYVVPWGDGLHMVGATVIESDDSGPITVRSALELLGMAYALHPAFGEAQIVDAGAGVRPAFADNVPKIIVRGQTIHVNGLYRHGFLLAPALAELVAEYLRQRRRSTIGCSSPIRDPDLSSP